MNMRAWRQGGVLEEQERSRLAELNRPPAANPPELLKPTRCRVLKPFFVGGKSVAPGTLVELQRHDAVSLAAIGKVEILK